MTGSDLRLEGLGDGGGTLALVGPSFWGSVFRAEARSVYYRVVPIRRVPPEGRQAIRRWLGRPPRPGLAPIADATQLTTGGAYLLRYDIRAERSLTDVLAVADPRTRLECAAGLLRAFPGWTDELGPGWLPMPADMVLTAANTLCVLPMPYRWAPDVGSVLSEPARAWYLAPEVIRGRPGTVEAADRYAIGMLALGCFSALRHDDAGDLLPRIATGTALAPPRARSLLPLWMEGLDATRRLLDAVGELLVDDPELRTATDLQDLADRIEALLPWTEPGKAVIKLWEVGRLADADLVLQEALLEAEPYDLLLLGGRLAEELHRPLQAVDLLERAIIREPDRPDGYELQLRILLNTDRAQELSVSAVLEGQARRLEDLLRRDFERLPPERREAAEPSVAEYLLERGRYEQVCSFVHPRLFEGPTWLWWKFGMNVAYATALVGVGRETDAERLIRELEAKFAHVLDNHSMPDWEVRPHRDRLLGLKAALRTSPEDGS